MAINHWPLNERPREKLLTAGAAVLSDAELLAILVRTGISGKTAVDIARNALKQMGGLRNLLNATPEKICQIPGLGEAKYAQLQAVLEIGKRYLAANMAHRVVLNDSEEIRHFLVAHLRDYPHEVFACFFLDNQYRMIAFVELFHGTLNHANIYPREIIKQALQHNAAALIFAHNHPSGIAAPSAADKTLTQQLKTALTCVEIQLLDHFIVGDNKVVSFAELGLL